MICLVKDISVFYEECGEGKPILFIHGWSPDHRMMKGCFEPVFIQMQGYRRIYIDLPGIGQTPGVGIRNSDDMLDILCEFIKGVTGDENFLLAGCSYGGYLALGLIHKMKEKIDGVLLLVAMVTSYANGKRPENYAENQVLWQSELLPIKEDNLSLQAYMSMAVIAGPEMYDKWQKDIQPGLDIADKQFLANRSIMDYSPDLEECVSNVMFDKPAAVLTGRQDYSLVCNYAKAYELAQRFTRATFAILDCAGHILQIDNEPIFQQLVKDWIWRVELEYTK